jgi:aconitate hydratase
MIRGLFTNLSVVNFLGEAMPPGYSIDALTGQVLPLYQVASQYAERGEATVILAGERYGQGSSRDWAAKGSALLGARAVLAQSFERIHRTNLIGMGVLPLRLPADLQPSGLGLRPGDRIEIVAEPEQVSPRADVAVTILFATGESRRFVARAEVETALEVDLLKLGGIVPLILDRAKSRRSHSKLSGVL